MAVVAEVTYPRRKVIRTFFFVFSVLVLRGLLEVRWSLPTHGGRSFRVCEFSARSL